MQYIYIAPTDGQFQFYKNLQFSPLPVDSGIISDGKRFRFDLLCWRLDLCFRY